MLAQALEARWRRPVELLPVPTDRMLEAQPASVQSDSAEAGENGSQCRARLRPPPRPVHRIADDAQTESAEVHADLVSPPRRQRDLETRREVAERLEHPIVGQGPLAGLDHGHALAVLRMPPDRPVDR